MSPAPSPEFQLAFLAKLQRLFAEGEFVATYKFALLIALADLCVEQGKDDGSTLFLARRDIATKYIEMYWQQSNPYSSGRVGTKTGVLVQSAGGQAAVVSAILLFRKQHPAENLQTASKTKAFEVMLRQVASTVFSQPIKYLQNMGGQTDEFIFHRVRDGIELLPGVSFCLRHFQPLIQQLSRSGWVGHVKKNRLNSSLLGSTDDLESFLFDASRDALNVIGAGLRKLTGGKCFYCGERVLSADVDHFIPFSLYPRNLAHNLVYAHDKCNRSKSDALAAKRHLEKWVHFLDFHSADLEEIGQSAGMVCAPETCIDVARWGYGLAYDSRAHAWVQAKRYEPVDDSYLACLAPA